MTRMEAISRQKDETERRIGYGDCNVRSVATISMYDEYSAPYHHGKVKPALLWHPHRTEAAPKFVAKRTWTEEVKTVMDSTAAKIALVVLALIGALVLLSAFGMFFMHTSMMGGSPLHGLWSSIAGMCRGMMGG